MMPRIWDHLDWIDHALERNPHAFGRRLADTFPHLPMYLVESPQILGTSIVRVIYEIVADDRSVTFWNLWVSDPLLRYPDYGRL